MFRLLRGGRVEAAGSDPFFSPIFNAVRFGPPDRSLGKGGTEGTNRKANKNRGKSNRKKGKEKRHAAHLQYKPKKPNRSQLLIDYERKHDQRESVLFSNQLIRAGFLLKGFLFLGL